MNVHTCWVILQVCHIMLKSFPGSVAEVSSGVAGGDRALHESNRIKLQSYVSSKLHKLVQITQYFSAFLVVVHSYLRKSFDTKI